MLFASVYKTSNGQNGQLRQENKNQKTSKKTWVQDRAVKITTAQLMDIWLIPPLEPVTTTQSVAWHLSTGGDLLPPYVVLL